MGLVHTKYVISSVLYPDAPPEKVLEVNVDDYILRHILNRDDSLVLYAPFPCNDKSPYEIVLHKSSMESSLAYSLLRFDNKEEAETKFLSLKDKVPVFFNIVKEMANVRGLQKMCDTVFDHPDWSLAHLAAHFGLLEAIKHDAVNSHLNSSGASTGVSPLQVAISTNSVHTVKVLIASKCSLEHLDHRGNSVFHYAATTNKEIITALTQASSSPHCLNMRNHNGHTPLHLACLADKPECVEALILGGADVNLSATCKNDCDPSTIPTSYVGSVLQENPNTLSSQEMKFGGTPLHWSSSIRTIEALVDANCDINARNFENRTALHVMVLRNRLDYVVALLTRQADPDLGDFEGNRPIHLAVKEGNLSIVQCLIVFGADIDALNNNGETARHLMTKVQEPSLLHYLHAVGAVRCGGDMTNCTEGCKAGGTYNGERLDPVMGPVNRTVLDQILNVPTEYVDKGERNRGGRLLCLDGGGIRGIVLIQILLEMEQVLNKPVRNSFDWIAGTSAGGILALGIASGKTMKECLCLYFRMKETTFVGLRPYQSYPLETLLKEILGSNTVMASIKEPKILITGALADRKPVDLHLFRNYQSPNAVLKVEQDTLYDEPLPPEKQLLWHVARATGAAPTYFRAFERFLDGGLIANNPTLDALTEIHELNTALRATNREDEVTDLRVVVSIGSGISPVVRQKVDVFRTESLWDSAKFIKALGAILVDQATACNGRVVDRARAWCSSIKVPYYRFTPQLSEDIAMDEKSDEKLVNMLWETKAYMHENLDTVRELASLLV